MAHNEPDAPKGGNFDEILRALNIGSISHHI